MDELNKNTWVQDEVTKHFNHLNELLAYYLENSLPLLSENWWNEAVINNLSPQQKRQVVNRRINSLRGLDLAGLIRVFDKNWIQISNRFNLAFEERHFVKEMQFVRNRWAHLTLDGITIDDAYRDLDTMERFAKIINAQPKLLENFQNSKKKLLSEKSISINSKADESTISQPENGKPIYKIGQFVRPKSNLDKRGPIVKVELSKPEVRYEVFIDNLTLSLFESQLVPEISNDELKPLSCSQFHAYLSALQLRYPGFSNLYSLNTARIDFIPYQFRPVLRFIRSDRPRMLIADSVGVGKTIEAGLILRELQARREVNSVLIICPRPLVTEKKWEYEMKRFEEQFIPLDGPNFNHFIKEMDLDGVWPQRYMKIIVPYSLFDENRILGTSSFGKKSHNIGLLNLDPPPSFDLVIVDEAHHVRNPNTYSHRAVKYFCDHAEAVLFLTATPVQMGSNDLYHLLSLLRPDLIIDKQSFEHMAEPNPFINHAIDAMRSQQTAWKKLALESLDKACSTAWGKSILGGNPQFEKVRTKLNGEITSTERVRLISDTENMHTFSGIINRTRRRDIGNFTTRRTDTIEVPFSTEQQAIHNELMKVQEEKFQKIHDQPNVKFLMTTIRRQAASCLVGLIPLLEEILTRHLDELAWEEADDTGVPLENAIKPIEDKIKHLLNVSKNIQGNDPKFQVLVKLIQDKQNLPNNKIMVFSSFRHTLSYLFEKLIEEGFRVGLIHGDTPDENRAELRKKFGLEKNNDEVLDIMLFSEIGCEGLDYQFCDSIINYDLPWNPMRIEQRIGRIDRHGQESESVAIINLITPGTVDAEIYNRCLLRIGVFESAIGGSEEILGEITSGIKNIAENFTLTPKEREIKFQQLAENKIRQIEEQNKLEKSQQELFGINLPKEQLEQEIKDASSYWLSSRSLFRLVNLYLQKVCGKDQEYILGEGSLKTLRVAQEFRLKLLGDFQKLSRHSNAVYREWENWLKGENQHLSITFESECARNNPKATFIITQHPLIKQAVRSYEDGQEVITSLLVKSSLVKPGNYMFAVYQWRYYGVREDLILKPIASDPVISEHLINLLKVSKDNPNKLTSEFKKSDFEKLEEQHYPLWKKAKEDHQHNSKQMIDYKKENLLASHQARMKFLEERLYQAKDKKIERMRKAEIDRAQIDYSRRSQELGIAFERADIVHDRVAFGTLEIMKG